MSKFIWSAFILDHEVVPAPRIPHDRRAQFLDQRTQRYFHNRDSLAWQLKSMWRKPSITYPVTFLAEVSVTHNRKCDWDNLGKTLGDALQTAGIVLNDNLIEKGEVTVLRGGELNYVAISLYEGVERTPCLVDIVEKGIPATGNHVNLPGTEKRVSKPDEVPVKETPRRRKTNGNSTSAGTAKRE